MQVQSKKKKKKGKNSGHRIAQSNFEMNLKRKHCLNFFVHSHQKPEITLA